MSEHVIRDHPGVEIAHHAIHQAPVARSACVAARLLRPHRPKWTGAFCAPRLCGE